MKQIPFAICPAEMFFDSRMGKNHLRVLGAIMTFRNRNTDLANPTREQIAHRLGRMPLTKVSTITSDLVKLGWLEKVGKGGYSKSCKYRVITPEHLTEQMERSVTDMEKLSGNKTVPDSGTVDDAETVTEKETVTKTGTVTETVTTTVPKTVTKRLPKQERARNRPEQTNNRSKESKPKKIFKKIDLSNLNPLIDEDVAKEWLAHRIAKRCPVEKQETFDRQMKQAIQASIDLRDSLGFTPNEVITKTIDAGWQGIEASWLLNRYGANNGNNSQGTRNETPAQRAQRMAEEQRESTRVVVDEVHESVSS